MRVPAPLLLLSLFVSCTLAADDAAAADVVATAESTLWRYWKHDTQEVVGGVSSEEMLKLIEAGEVKAITPVSPEVEGLTKAVGAWRPVLHVDAWSTLVDHTAPVEAGRILYYFFDLSTKAVSEPKGMAAVKAMVAAGDVVATTLAVRYYERAWAPFSQLEEFKEMEGVARWGVSADAGAPEPAYYYKDERFHTERGPLHKAELQHLLDQGWLSPSSKGRKGALPEGVKAEDAYVSLDDLDEALSFPDTEWAKKESSTDMYFYVVPETHEASKPIHHTDLAALLASGKLDEETLVNRAGGDGWHKAWAFPELFEETFVVWNAAKESQSQPMTKWRVQELIASGLFGVDTFCAKTGETEWTLLKEREEFVWDHPAGEDDAGGDAATAGGDKKDAPATGAKNPDQQYVYHDNEHGHSAPLTLPKLKALMEKGAITSETPVAPVGAGQGKTSWRPLGDLLENTEEDESIQPGVHLITDFNFDSATKDGRYWLIAATVPTCGFCKRLFPELTRLADVVTPDHPVFALGQFNGNRAKALTKRFEITGYPTIFIMTPSGQRVPYTNHRYRTAEKFLPWLKDTMDKDKAGTL